MSGGHFQYDQYKIGYIADEVKQLILNNDKIKEDEQGFDCWTKYELATIEKFEEAYVLLRKAQIAAQRIDWLVSGDDGQETFLERWQEDMTELYRELKK